MFLFFFLPIWHNRPAWIKKHYKEFCKAENFKYYCMLEYLEIFKTCSHNVKNFVKMSVAFSSDYMCLYTNLTHYRYLNYEIIALFWFCNVKQKKYDKYRIDKYIDMEGQLLSFYFFRIFFYFWDIRKISSNWEETRWKISNPENRDV